MKYSILGGLGALVVCAGMANAQVILEDENSRVDIDPLSSSGMYNWIVDGTDHLFQQWFWYRIGGAAEASIDTIGAPVVVVSNTNFDPRPDTMFASYANNLVQIDVTLSLQGGTNGSGRSDVAEQIRIINTSGTFLPITFFQYCDFDLNGSSGGDNVAYDGVNPGNIVRQWEGFTTLAETVVTPAAHAWEAANFPFTLNHLTDAGPSALNNNMAAAGDSTWAYEWGVVLAPGESFQISKDKNITPAPGALALLGLSGLIVARRRRA